MPDLSLTGRVTRLSRFTSNTIDVTEPIGDFDRPTHDPLPQPRLVPLDLHVQLGLAGSGASFATTQVVTTDDEGRFELALDVADLEQLGPLAALRATVIAYMPFDRQQAIGINALLAAPLLEGPGTAGERIFRAAERALRDLRLAVDMTGLLVSTLEIGALPGDTTDAFEDHDPITFDLLDAAGRHITSAPLRSDRTVRLVHPQRLPECFARIRADTILPDLFGGRSLGRSRLIPAQQSRSFRPKHLAVQLHEERIGIGTLSDTVPEELVVPGQPLVAHRIDLDFVDDGAANRVLRFRCDVGLGGRGDDDTAFVIADLGQFTGHYEFALIGRASAFDDAELRELVEISAKKIAFDVTPGTDLDKLIFAGGESGCERAIARMVSDQILPRIRRQISTRVRDAIAAQRTAAITGLAATMPGVDPTSTVDAVFGTLFVEPTALSISANNLRLGVHVWVWDDLVALLGSDLECPVNTLAAVAPRTNIRAAGRAVQMMWKRHGHADLLETFGRFRGELRTLVLRDRSVSRRFASFVVATHGALTGTRGPLTEKEAREAYAVALAYLEHVPAEVRARVKPMLELLPACVGLDATALRTLLFGRATPSR